MPLKKNKVVLCCHYSLRKWQDMIFGQKVAGDNQKVVYAGLEAVVKFWSKGGRSLVKRWPEEVKRWPEEVKRWPECGQKVAGRVWSKGGRKALSP